jgi:uncharacterized membrane protein YhhN
VIVLATLVCAISCAVLVFAEWRGHAMLRVIAKLVASAAFVIVGAQAFWIAHDPVRVGFGHWLFLGMVLGAIGDAALLGHGKPWFLAGLGAFLLGHLAYVAGISVIEPPSAWLTDAGIYAALPIVAGGIALALLWPKLGTMRVPVIGYVLAIVAMVVAAIAAARGQALPEPHRLRLVAGAAVFFVSDLAVARDRFVARTFRNKLWGLPAYYGGQLLIAWSVVGL